MSEIKVEGLKELQKAMEALGRKTRNKISVKAMRKGGAIIREQARHNAPTLKTKTPYRKAGTLKKAIKSRTKINAGGKVNTYVWVKGLTTKQVIKFKGKTNKSGSYNPKDPFYWRFVEFGTSKMPAKPFLRPAFNEKKEQATQEIIKTLKQEITNEGSKH